MKCSSGLERSDKKRRNSLAEYRNPQNEPGSDKRMLIALVAVFVVLGVMQYFMPKPQTPPAKGQQQQQCNSPSSRPARGCSCSLLNAGAA